MATNIPDTSLLDMVKTTLPNLTKGKFTTLLKYQRYPYCEALFGKERQLYRGGKIIDKEVMVTESTTAQNVGAYQTFDPNVEHFVAVATQRWAGTGDSYVIDEIENGMNVGAARIVDMIKIRRQGCFMGLANRVEESFYACPASTGTDAPMGIPNYVCEIAEAGEGFYGGVPRNDGTTYGSTVSGINPLSSGSGTSSILPAADTATYKTRWRNYCAGGSGYYLGEVDTTAVTTMSKAFLKIGFQAPRHMADLANEENPVSRLRIFAGINPVIEFAKLARAGNDQLGADVARYDNKTVFNGIPIEYMPVLDAQTTLTDPIYMLDFNHLYPVIQSGFELKEYPRQQPQQPTVVAVYVIMRWNLVCTDRRRQAVIHEYS